MVTPLPPTSLWARVVSFALGAYKVLYRKCDLVKLQIILHIDNTTTVGTIKTTPKGLRAKFSRNFEGEDEMNENTSSVCRLSKGCNSNVLGTIWCVELKLTELVVRAVELIKRKYLHPNATTFTHTTSTVTIITASIITTATKF